MVYKQVPYGGGPCSDIGLCMMGCDFLYSLCKVCTTTVKLMRRRPCFPQMNPPMAVTQLQLTPQKGSMQQFQLIIDQLVVKVTQSCPTLCDPMDYTVHGILQARILEWIAVPFSRGSSQPWDRTQVSRRESLPQILYQLNHQGSPDELVTFA